MKDLVSDDDYLHPITDNPNHNESAYYNFGTPGGLVGWLRIGNRVNDGFAEVTVCLHFPDGRVGLWWDRADLVDPSRHDAGGLSFTVIEPFKRHRIEYAGQIAMLRGPRELEDPGSAFKAAERLPASISLELEEASPPWGGGSKGHNSAAFDNFAGNHFEQHMTVTGTVRVGDEEFPIRDGLTMRDHSWGPRNWQQISWYRWLTCSFSRDLGFACTIIGNSDGSYVTQGYVHRGPAESLRDIVSAVLTTEWDDTYPTKATWELVDDTGERYTVVGEVGPSVPLRNRRNGSAIRIIEGATTYRMGSLVGVGMSEYLDSLVDGEFIGVAAEQRSALGEVAG